MHNGQILSGVDLSKGKPETLLCDIEFTTKFTGLVLYSWKAKQMVMPLVLLTMSEALKAR
jgi:hypothetical protein